MVWWCCNGDGCRSLAAQMAGDREEVREEKSTEAANHERENTQNFLPEEQAKHRQHNTVNGDPVRSSPRLSAANKYRP